MTGELAGVRVVEYPHVTTDAGACNGQPCIADTGVRVIDLARAYENGNLPSELQEYFTEGEAAGGTAARHLSLPEVHAALAYYYDNLEALAALRAEDELVAAAATRERHAAILKHYLGG